MELLPVGFIIIPAISELSPLKFITYTGTYDPYSIPPYIKNMTYRLCFTCLSLGYIQPSQVSAEMLIEAQKSRVLSDQISKNESMWDEFITQDWSVLKHYLTWETAVAPLLKSLWRQGYPYNLYTPEINGKNCPVGCVATATAQIMYYWKYPRFGEQFFSYYWTTGDKILSARFDHEYPWNKMLDQYNDPLNPPSAEQIDIIARLCSDIGIAQSMEYKSNGSIPKGAGNLALVSFFKYSQNIERVGRQYYDSWNEWFQVFKEQLDKKWPVYLGTRKKGGGTGHAVVVDGYRTNGGINQVHVNLGWGFGGYYTLDDIVGAYGTDTDSANINIHPGHCVNKGRIRGRVTNLYGDRQKNAYISLYDLERPHASGLPFIKLAPFNENGDYTLNCLGVRKYKIRILGQYPLCKVQYWYDEKYGEDQFDSADSIEVKANQDTILNFKALELSLQIERKEEWGVYIRKDYAVIKCKAKGYILSLRGWYEDECPLSKYYLMKKEPGGQYTTIKEINWKIFEHQEIDRELKKNQSYTYKLIAKDNQGKIVATSKEITI